MTTTIDPAEDVADDDPAPGSSHSALRAALGIALATALLLAAAAGVVFVFVHKSPDTPAPVAQQAPAAPAPTPPPDEQFLAAWHQVAPGVAARRSDATWLRIGVSACNLIGVPGATPDVISRVLGSNLSLMSVTEGTQLLGVANAKLCPEKAYVAGPTLVLPSVAFPELGAVTVPHVGAPSIPTVHVSPPKISAPTIPGTGGGNSGSSPMGGSGSPSGSSSPKLIPPSRLSDGGVHTEN